MNDGEKVCPRCRCEYLANVTECADCGVALVPPDQLPEEVAPDELPPASEMVALRIATIPFIRALSEMLQAAGISHRVDSAPGPSDEGDGRTRARRQSHDVGVAVFVLPEDAEAALAVDAEFLAQQIPDQQADGEAADDESCPACGDPVALDAPECPGCGLPFLEAG